jgi:hypothetical protein
MCVPLIPSPNVFVLTLMFKYGYGYCVLPQFKTCAEDSKILDRIEFLDIIYVYARLSAALGDPNRDQLFFSCRGPIAKSLLNDIQEVCVAGICSSHAC